MVNTVGDFIRSVFPTLVHKNNEVFNILFANATQTGTIEKIFNELEDVRKEWIVKGSNFYEQIDECFEKTLLYFSVLNKINNDTRESFQKRLELVFIRNGRTIWGTKWDIQEIFRAFFNTNKVWIVNNTDEANQNLISNGNFEVFDKWDLVNCEYSNDAKLEGNNGIFFNATGTLSQTININSTGVYFLHFFIKGSIKVSICDNNNRFWNFTGGEFGAWQNAEVAKEMTSEEWNNESVFFIADKKVKSIKVIFSGVAGKIAYLDYVRCYKKTLASTFSVVCVFRGVKTDETANLAPGEDDPITGFKFNNKGYFSPGEEDARERKGENFFDKDFVNDDVSPVLTDKNKDVEPMAGYENMSYLGSENYNGDFILDKTSKNDEQKFEKGVNYEKLSYYDRHFLFGASGVKTDVLYRDLLELIKPAGVISYIEIINEEN